MPQSSAILSREGQLLNIAPGQVVRIDPGLVDEFGVVLNVDQVMATSGFLVVGQQGVSPFFWLQNITTAARAVRWFATSLHTIQHAAGQAIQATVGPGGALSDPAQGVNIGSVPSTGNSIYVNVAATGATPDGSLLNPFPTIQAALNLIFARKDASSANRYNVMIAPGLYVESLILRSPFTRLVEQGPRGSVVIQSATALEAALIITDATLASIAAFYAAGGKDRANADAQALLLVHDPDVLFGAETFPRDSGAFGCQFTSATPDPTNDCCVMYINTQNAVDVLTTQRFFFNSLLEESLYSRNSGSWMLYYVNIEGQIVLRNTRVVTVRFATITRGGSLQFDAAQPNPIGATNTQISLANVAMFLTLQTEASGSCGISAFDSFFSAFNLQGAGSTTLQMCYVSTDVTQQSTHTFTATDCQIGRDFLITNPGVMSTTLRNTDILRNVNLAVGGAKTFVFQGGTYGLNGGTVTDPDLVFNHNTQAFPFVKHRTEALDAIANGAFARLAISTADNTLADGMIDIDVAADPNPGRVNCRFAGRYRIKATANFTNGNVLPRQIDLRIIENPAAPIVRESVSTSIGVAGVTGQASLSVETIVVIAAATLFEAQAQASDVDVTLYSPGVGTPSATLSVERLS